MEKSCGVVLFNEQKVLLLQYATGQKEGEWDLQGHWDFPKGHVDKGETEIETATRELEEETGIKNIILLDNFRKTINYKIQKRDRKISKEVVFFIATTVETEINLSHEHVDYGWFDFTSALKQLTYDNARSVLSEAIIFYGKN
ncbi:MAG: bis(5'-nucleosyl)-tetraphosphatase [Candidatus Poseidoniia archaeon]|nr:bis(5'-nucleosyl)-tetraphosphatase [Candidatus Poseidoniia archaeon]